MIKIIGIIERFGKAIRVKSLGINPVKGGIPPRDKINMVIHII